MIKGQFQKGGHTMGDKSPKNTAKAKKQKSDKKTEAARRAAPVPRKPV